jgi:4-aminobutyrate aminotransferase-like enzyme
MDPGNAYTAAALDGEWAMFEASTAVPTEVMTAQFQHSLEGIGDRREPTTGLPVGARRLFPELAGKVSMLDLSVTSDALHSGQWLGADAESTLAAQALVANGAVLTRHGEHRLTRTTVDTTQVAATLALGVEAHLTGPTQVRAPWPGTVTRHAESGLTLTSEGLRLVLDGIDADCTGGVRAGQPMGTVAAGDSGHSIHVQLSRLAEGLPPRFVTPELAAGWLALSPDPTELITPAPGRPVAGDPVPALLERRERSYATVQEHYFTVPPRIERGWRHYLVDMEGRGYLDMVNNVTVLGHGHPRLASAVHQQWQLLNTNSRFHYESVVRLSEQLTATLPDQLNTEFLVNSGSEAVDLALRLAWAATGRQDVVAMDEAYHGWTYASDAVSTSTVDNPAAAGSRPAWVHTVSAPNSYRGTHRGPEADRYGPEAVAVITDLARSGRPPAAFLCEPYYGNAGGIKLPDGYLAQVYAATRAAGGLCIADEVQVGLGRLGSWFWGFEQQKVVPDIVTIAKAMGNGHPLITRRDIAEAYRPQGYFFSSAGGSPVSSVVGLTVLDVLRDERLQENAGAVGAYLRSRLQELADRHPLIGAVHGTGLYLGVELVRDPHTLEPATEETAAICDRLRELGVIAQPTSDRMCVLKIKPPLCLTTTSADVFVAALDDVLTNGW